MKRFWEKAEPAARDGGFAILLDGRPMRLPDGAVLCVPGRALAAAVAEEWQQAGGAKGGEMSFADTPLTRLAGTAQQRIAPDPGASVRALAAYGRSDLLCYRATEPAALVARQHEAWQPWLDWVGRRHGAALRVAQGIGFVEQPPASLLALERALAALDPVSLAALGIAVPALGSLVLGLALADGALSAAEAHALGVLDEAFQAEFWGEDEEAASRRAGIARDVAEAAQCMALARQDRGQG
ncbi:MAG: chaperone, ATP12 [Rhodospirillales bacterium]|nr:chaperone, ATP12 [Rhodospirillales bacterium]